MMGHQLCNVTTVGIACVWTITCCHSLDLLSTTLLRFVPVHYNDHNTISPEAEKRGWKANNLSAFIRLSRGVVKCENGTKGCGVVHDVKIS